MSEKTEILKDIAREFRKIKNRSREDAAMGDSISSDERDTIRDEFVAIADRIRRKYGLTIPDTRRAMRDILDVSI